MSKIINILFMVLICACSLNHLSFGKEHVRVLMIGLDKAGKTTILNKLKLNRHLMTIPTIGFNVETLDYKNFDLDIWDVGGQCTLRALWRHYFVDGSVIVFVVDSTDSNRLRGAAMELHKMMGLPELQDTVLLVYANKQDLPAAINLTKITEILRLSELKQPWHLQPAIGVNGTGLWEGIEKLTEMFEKHKK